MNRRAAGIVLCTLLGGLASESEAACRHRYFPLEPGTELTYRAGKAEVRLSVVKADQAGAGLRIRNGGREATTRALCTDGGIALAQGGLEGTLLQSGGMRVD